MFKVAAASAEVVSLPQTVPVAASATDGINSLPDDQPSFQDAAVEPQSTDAFNNDETVGDSEVNDSAPLPPEGDNGSDMRLLNTVLLTISAMMLLAIGVLIGIYLSPPPKSGGHATGGAGEGTGAKSVVAPAKGISPCLASVGIGQGGFWR
ncbi:MAG: hypothetical protein ACP5O7_00690 [Phycisphaerae bacterium]